jgi:hypothetical protein
MPHPSMILIASEQLWPNLHALIHWSLEDGGLEDVHILHTSNDSSALPARRLHALLNRARDKPFRYRKLHPLQQVGTQPQDIAAATDSIVTSAHGSDWIIIANGGLKTMTLGLLPAMANPRVTVAYSEIGSGWQRLLGGPGRVTTEPLPRIDAADMDRIPVEALIEAQHVADPKGIRLSIQRVIPLDTAAIARACMTNQGWDWQAGFRTCGLPPKQPGTLFEEWCGALLLELGVTNLVGGVKVKGDGTPDASESDLLCIHQGKFHYLELKLRDDEEKETFLEIARKASINCRTFGGMSGVAHLLLPNWKLGAGDQALLPLFRPSPTLLQAPDSSRFISTLAERLEIATVPPHLVALEAGIAAWMQDLGLTRAFGQEPKFLQSSGKSHERVFANMQFYVDCILAERSQNWILLQDRGEIRLIVERIPGRAVPPGWEPYGQRWNVTRRASPEFTAALKTGFRPFLNCSVDPDQLIRAWQTAAGGPKSSRN